MESMKEHRDGWIFGWLVCWLVKREERDLLRHASIPYCCIMQANDINSTIKPKSGNIYSVVFLFYRQLQCWQHIKIYGFFLRFDGFHSLQNISIHWMIIWNAKCENVLRWCNDEIHKHSKINETNENGNEQTNERTNKRANERTKEWKSP